MTNFEKEINNLHVKKKPGVAQAFHAGICW